MYVQEDGQIVKVPDNGNGSYGVVVREVSLLRVRRRHLQLTGWPGADVSWPNGVGLWDPYRRRVPGLRREELSMLAGLSAPYYTRLERGQSRNASRGGVLDAIATALRLDESERAHLHELAREPKRGKAAPRPRPERITPATSALLAALEGTPAIVMGSRNDVLAWNTQGHASFAGHLDRGSPDEPGRRPNMAKLVFLDAHTRDLYTDWPTKAKAVVGNLRITAGRPWSATCASRPAGTRRILCWPGSSAN